MDILENMFTGERHLNQSDCSMKMMLEELLWRHNPDTLSAIPIFTHSNEIKMSSMKLGPRPQISCNDDFFEILPQKNTDNRAYIINKLLHGSLACMDYIHSSKIFNSLAR